MMTVTLEHESSSHEIQIPDEGAEFLRSLYKGSQTSESVESLEVERPWGCYRRVDVGFRYQVKRIVVAPGGKLSLQRHYHRAEHWIVLSGIAEVTVDGATFILLEGNSIDIPQGAVHRCANPGKIPVIMIEVQIGTYTGEDDIVRLEDLYGRL